MNEAASKALGDTHWTTKCPKIVFVSSNANNINVRHMQTVTRGAERDREREEEGTQELSQCVVSAHMRSVKWQRTVGWHCGTVAAGKQSVASHLDTCNNSIVWTSIKEDWWQATDRAGQRLLWSLYSQHTHTHINTHTLAHRYLYSFVCWDRWKNDS